MDSNTLMGVRVLLVDDSYDTRESLRVLLKQQGADVVAVSSVEEALVEIARQPPDLLLSDLAMPDEDGFSLIERVRALPPSAGGRVAAAAFTAYSSPESRVRAIAAGFSGYITKPVDPDHLVDVMRELVRAARSAPPEAGADT